MIFQQLYALYTSYQAQKNIRRYITGISLVFGKKYSIPAFPNPIVSYGPSPAGNKLRVYNSALEAIAERDNNGVAEYINTQSFPEIKTIALDPAIVKDIMELNSDVNAYLKNTAFFASMIYMGKYKRFRYDPRYMFLEVTTTTDQKVFEKFKAAAEYEKLCQGFVVQAQRNAKALAALSLDPKLTKAEADKLSREITNHLAVINTFKSKLPEGFYLDVKELRADNIGLIFLGIPVIVWVAGLITAGVIGLTAYYISRQSDVKVLQASLDARYKAIMSITDDKTRNQALQDAAAATSKTIDTAAENTGMLGQIKQMVLIAGAAFVIKELIPLFKPGKN